MVKAAPEPSSTKPSAIEIIQNIGSNTGLVAAQIINSQIIVYAAREIHEGAGIAAPSPNALEVGENPYRGLEAFQETDADRFFGREKQVDVLWNKLQAFHDRSRGVRFLAVYGPSGSGKSSLVRAGLIPALAQKPLPGYGQARIVGLVPGSHPLHSLASMLIRSLETQKEPDPKRVEQFANTLNQVNQKGEFDGLYRIATVVEAFKTSPLIILVDQFEEVFSLCDDPAERAAFIENLLIAAADRSKRVSVVVTLRSDFLAETQSHSLLNRCFSTQGYLVPAMTTEELRQAISLPAEKAGYFLNEGTVQLLIEQCAGREGALPLLQFALTQIWEGLRQGKQPAATLMQIGGVGGALAKEAQRIFDELEQNEQAIARRVFLGLIQLGEGAPDTRRRVSVEHLVVNQEKREQVREVIDRFASPGARLITLSGDETGKETAEITHEALITHWQLYREWLDSSRDDLRFQRQLEEAALHWQKSGQQDGNLWRRPNLDLLRSFHSRLGSEMTELQHRFLQVSNQAEQKRKRLWTAGIAGLVGLTVITLGISVVAVQTAHRAKEQRQLSLARQLATQANSISQLAGASLSTSILLAVESNTRLLENGSISRVERVDADSALRKFTSLLSIKAIARLKHDYRVGTTAFSPNGKILVTADLKGITKLWDVQSGQELARMNSDQVVLHIAFSPDSKIVATAGVGGAPDNTVHLWDSQSGRELTHLTHDSHVQSIAFSPDGTTIATASLDGTARLWDVKNAQQLLRLDHDVTVNAVAFSPDGKTFVTVSGDTARLWDSQSGQELISFNHNSLSKFVAFSPDGKTVATGSNDDTVKLWSAQSGQELASLDAESTINALAFSPDGRTIITASRDSRARLWDSQSGRELAKFKHYDSEADDLNLMRIAVEGVTSVAYSPDSKTVATAGVDKTVRLWDIQKGEEIARLNHDDEVWNLSFSPDGRIIATASGGTVQLWNTQSDQELPHFFHDSWDVFDVVFSSDGRTIATSSNGNMAWLWDAESGRKLARLEYGIPDEPLIAIKSFTSGVEDIAFSPDGRTLAAAGLYGTVSLLDSRSGKELFHLNHKAFDVAYSPDGQFFATANDDKTARLWDTQSGKELFQLKHDASVVKVAFSPNHKIIATTTLEGTAWLWDTQNGQRLTQLNPNNLVAVVIFSPDGRTVATIRYDKDDVELLDVQTGEKLVHIKCGDFINAIVFSPDGKIIATAHGQYGKPYGMAQLWDTQSGKRLASVSHDEGVVDVAFSPDGKVLATAGVDKTARLWDVQSGAELARLSHNGAVNAVDFSSDGKFIATANSGSGKDNSTGGTAQIWYVSTKDLIVQACQRLTRNLTHQEWQRYLGDEPYRRTCPNLPDPDDYQ